MSESADAELRQVVTRDYAAALRLYLSGEGEAALARAYELGRRMAGQGMGVLDIALLHHEALHDFIVRAPAGTQAPILMAAQFLAESLSPFEMTLRAYQANARLLGLSESLAKQNTEIDRAREQLRSILDATTAVIYLKDTEGRYLFVNRQFQQVFGLAPEQVLGKLDAEVAPGPIAEALRSNDLQVLEARTPHEVEETIPCADGLRTYISLKFPLLDAAGASYALCCVATDITERKRAAQALEKAEAEAARANRAKSEFLSRMSHELRTPLNSILGFGQLLELGPTAPDQQESVALILRAGRHLLNLINEMLDISRIEAGGLRLSLEPVSVGEALRAALDLVRPLAQDQGIALAGDMPVDDRHVLADHQRLQQVLLNLLSNAVKYNRPGGRVVVSCGEVEPGRFRISVSDTGAGLTAAQLGRLFTPFDRLGAEGRGVEGTGLGLALSRHLIQAMGGVVHVESTPGEGSTFSVVLPLAAGSTEESAVGPPAAADGAATSTALRVLYVEDNLANLRLVERILTLRPGVKLLSALRGRDGIDLCRQEVPDLVLLDQHLPDMTGDEVLGILRADPGTRDIPVVMLSADASPGQIRRLLAAGARDYLTKPLDVPKLLALIDETGGRTEP
jgi:PAS domain S-box-containing protein